MKSTVDFRFSSPHYGHLVDTPRRAPGILETSSDVCRQSVRFDPAPTVLLNDIPALLSDVLSGKATFSSFANVSTAQDFSYIKISLLWSFTRCYGSNETLPTMYFLLVRFVDRGLRVVSWRKFSSLSMLVSRSISLAFSS